MLFIPNFFFLLNWRDLHSHEHFKLEISYKCDIKAEKSSTSCKFHERRNGLRPMGSNADPLEMKRTYFLKFVWSWMFGDRVERVWMHSSEHDTLSFITFPFGLSAVYFSDDKNYQFITVISDRPNQNLKMIWTLKMTTARVVETSVIVNNNKLNLL